VGLKRKMPKFLKLLLIALTWITFGMWVFKIFSFYQADVFFESSQSKIDAGDYFEANQLINRAIALNPSEPNYYRGRARINVISLSVAEEEYVQEIKSEIFHDLDKAYKLNTNNLVTIRNIIPLYYFLAVKDITIKDDSTNVDENYINIAKDFMQMAKSRFKNDAGVYALSARYEKRLGLTKEYGDSVKRISHLRPDLLEWYPF
jgi:tetratricopeptide (TPR) repeat protein